jgi:hypothetical protein
MIRKTSPLLALSLLAWVARPAAAGSGETGFLRGAVTGGDWEIDIADPSLILSYLFLGGSAEPGCLDAADADDDGRVELNDAIYLLQHLFLGGDPPLPPFPDPGPDSRADSLDCLEVPCRAEKLEYEARPEAHWDFIEFCIPEGDEYAGQVSALYPEVRYLPGSRGRIGFEAEQVLTIIEWRDVERSKVCRLSSLEFIAVIRGSHWE